MSCDRPAVVLVNPRMAKPRSVRLPLSLLALGAALEGRYRYAIVDGNVEADAERLVLERIGAARDAVVAITVMPGPQVAPAIRIASVVRQAAPGVRIVWGGYFPTLYPESAINAPYVDYVVRGQGEDTLVELLDRLAGAAPRVSARAASDDLDLSDVRGLTWKPDGGVTHNRSRPFRPPDDYPLYPYQQLGDVGRYLKPSFLGRRTAVHQAAMTRLRPVLMTSAATIAGPALIAFAVIIMAKRRVVT